MKIKPHSKRFKILNAHIYLSIQMGGTQTQQMINRQLNTKLDRIAKMLSVVLERMDEAEPDRKPIKKIAKEWNGIDSGRIKVHHYRNLADFEKAIS